MVHAIEELQDAHVEPDVWTIEGLDSREDCERIVAAARPRGKDKVGCIIPGHVARTSRKCVNGRPRPQEFQAALASPSAERISGNRWSPGAIKTYTRICC
jgi:hypothetical protein